jgi:hypothetical protein
MTAVSKAFAEGGGLRDSRRRRAARGSYVLRFLLFLVTIRPFARDVLSQAEGCHAFGGGILDDLFRVDVACPQDWLEWEW